MLQQILEWGLPVIIENIIVAVFFLLTGIIKAKQLDYSEAHKNLIQAIRKAPQFSAIGFRQIVSS